MDSYLTRFERYAYAQSWKEEKRAINLSALLTGKALEVYYRMPSDEIEVYQSVKQALLKNFQFTEEGFRQKLFSGKANPGETATQFYTRMEGYFNRWISLSKITQDYKSLKDLVLKMAFLGGCNTTLAVHLKEQSGKTNKELVELAEVYMQAHNWSNLSSVTTATANPRKSSPQQSTPSTRIICLYCGKPGHKSPDCRLKKFHADVTCHFCNEKGHIQPLCPKKKGIPSSSSVTNSQPSNNFDKDVTCFKCQKKGHMSRNCPWKDYSCCSS